MDDTPHHRHPADWEPPIPSEAELLASLARSEAVLAAGQMVSGDEVLRELDESVAWSSNSHMDKSARGFAKHDPPPTAEQQQQSLTYFLYQSTIPGIETLFPPHRPPILPPTCIISSPTPSPTCCRRRWMTRPRPCTPRNLAAIAKAAALLPVNANESDLAAQCTAAGPRPRRCCGCSASTPATSCW
jgi:hypothetical protein